MKNIPNMFDVPFYLPPPLQTMCSALMEMSGCVVETNVNRGNPNGNNKNKKAKKATPKHTPGRRGPNIRIGKQG